MSGNLDLLDRALEGHDQDRRSEIVNRLLGGLSAHTEPKLWAELVASAVA